MFKNLCAYRLSGWTLTAEALAEQLATQAFQPCGAMAIQSTGWTAPRDGGALVHAVQGKLLIQLTTEEKILPKSGIDPIVKARAIELEGQQGFKPGRKQMKELREQIIDEKLPAALAKQSNLGCIIDPANGWLIVDTAAGNRADQLFKVLLKSLESLPAMSLRCMRSPISAMTDWLSLDDAPAGFTIDRDAELRSTGQDKATVKYRNHTMEVDDVRRHIAAGKQCVQLAMTWNDRISFVLTEALMIKRVAPLDVLKETGAESTMQNAAEIFDGDFLLMASEYAKLLADLVQALGGYEQKAAA